MTGLILVAFAGILLGYVLGLKTGMWTCGGDGE